MKTTRAEKIALLKRNTLDMLKAWSLLPRAFSSIKVEARTALGSLLDAFSSLGFALLAILVILLAPLFFWVSPVVTLIQLKRLKPKPPSTDIWDGPLYYKDEETK